MAVVKKESRVGVTLASRVREALGRLARDGGHRVGSVRGDREPPGLSRDEALDLQLDLRALRGRLELLRACCPEVAEQVVESEFLTCACRLIADGQRQGAQR